jgi:Raf kinase inhibitor-like YbhB/YbcL family protein
MPAGTRALAAGGGAGGNGPFKQSLNDGGKPGYTGMCPPKGKGLHHYHFRLFALDVANLDVAADASVRDVEQAAERHQRATAELVGTFERE